MTGSWTAALVLAACFAAAARAQEEKEEEKEEAPAGWIDGDRLTGEWLGKPGSLEDRGFALSGFLLDDFTRIQKGGLDRHSEANRYWLEARLDLDLHHFGFPKGGRLSAAFWQLGGEDGSADVPAFQTISVYESDFRRELGELFVEQTFAGSWRVKVGKMDASYDFTYTDYGNDFMNLGESFPPNLLAIPTIPDPAAGGALFYEPETGPYAGAGVFDGALQEGVATGRRGAATLFGPPSDLYGIFEGGWASDSARLGLGAWHHTGDFPEWKGGVAEGTTGWYGILEGKVAGDLYGILRYTRADERINPIERHWVAAAVWKGPLPCREKDALGAAWMVADLTDDAAAGMRSSTEQVLEAYYKIQVTPFFSVMPDVQWIANGGGGVRDALILGVRIVVTF